MIVIDGAMGEGGGQVLRSCLTLSLLTGQPFTVRGIRAGRKKPGLLPQHLTAVRAAATVGRAGVSGDALGSRELRFHPGAVTPGDYRFAVGTAGSATLVLQTVLPPLLTADRPARLTLAGGTHNAWAPPFEFLAEVFLPLLGRMGARVEATLERPGFHPAGGGRLVVTVAPVARLARLELLERGALLARRARALSARLPGHVTARELEVVRSRLGWTPAECVAESTVESRGPGNVVLLAVEHAHVTELCTGFGRRGVPAEQVAGAAVAELERYLAAGVPVGEHLADQLLLPLAMAGGGALRTLAPSGHLRTNLDVLGRFLDVRTRLEQRGEDDWLLALDVSG